MSVNGLRREAAALREVEALELRLEVAERRMRVRGICPEDWRDVERRHPTRPRREKITLRVDRDVAAWFRRKGLGYQAQMNAVLRAYMVMKAGGALEEEPADLD